jgi:hypothetical protein
VGKPEGKDHLEDLGINGRVVLEETWEGVDCIYVALDRDKCQARVNTVWSLQVPSNVGIS